MCNVENAQLHFVLDELKKTILRKEAKKQQISKLKKKEKEFRSKSRFVCTQSHSHLMQLFSRKRSSLFYHKNSIFFSPIPLPLPHIGCVIAHFVCNYSGTLILYFEFVQMVLLSAAVVMNFSLELTTLTVLFCGNVCKHFFLLFL